MDKESFQSLLTTRSLKIERIISTGQATKKGKWLKSKRNEWVIMVKGAAKLRFFKNNRIVKMKAGSHVLIPANTLHRVDWTDPGQKTIWLAVYYK
ncbi:MAG: cupin [Candidatus Omnitrophota bacterium]